VSVLPDFQNRGIGSQFIREGLEECRRSGYDLVVVPGHPTYYPRFGFKTAKVHGLDNEYNSVESFMALAFREGILGRISGLVKYVPEFQEAGL